MFSRILYYISSFLSVEIHDDPSMPHLEQYKLFSLFGVEWHLRRFINGDGFTPHGHEASWAFMLVISGWYKEHLYEESHNGYKHYKSRRVNILTPNLVTKTTYHVVCSCRRNSWVLVISSKQNEVPVYPSRSRAPYLETTNDDNRGSR
jgi:hypothetical protein